MVDGAGGSRDPRHQQPAPGEHDHAARARIVRADIEELLYPDGEDFPAGGGTVPRARAADAVALIGAGVRKSLI